MRVLKAMMQRSRRTDVTPMWIWASWAARGDIGMPGNATSGAVASEIVAVAVAVDAEVTVAMIRLVLVH
jgi:hypothetical protein